MSDKMNAKSTHDDTPVFAVVAYRLPPTGVRWTDGLPAAWRPTIDSVFVNVGALIMPMKLVSDNWRSHAGSFQYGDSNVQCGLEDPVTAAVREVAKLAGYDGAVSLGLPDRIDRGENAEYQSDEYRYWATFDSPAFVNQTIIVTVILTSEPWGSTT